MGEGTGSSRAEKEGRPKNKITAAEPGGQPGFFHVLAAMYRRPGVGWNGALLPTAQDSVGRLVVFHDGVGESEIIKGVVGAQQDFC